ncbi:MAG: prephenate dehydratase [Pseudomonadaceae bacterium]|nr:prephenate dehydratase [Pseudomonadaceae bacterium]
MKASFWKTVAFQGEPGAYAHVAASQTCPKAKPLPCATFEAAFDAVAKGKADGAVIPLENSTMGRIADIHHLLPESTLHIVGEVYLPIRHHLLAVKGAKLADIREVYSQYPALLQCDKSLKKNGLKPVQWGDTAGAAAHVAKLGDTSKAALASSLAGEVYGLHVLHAAMNDHDHNTTRFILLGRTAVLPPAKAMAKTSLLFRTRNIPAALYKALGGFATNGINLTKLESYQLGGRFNHTQFYADVDGHIKSPAMQRAVEELNFYADFVRIVGCYAAAEK